MLAKKTYTALAIAPAAVTTIFFAVKSLLTADRLGLLRPTKYPTINAAIAKITAVNINYGLDSGGGRPSAIFVFESMTPLKYFAY